MSRRNIAAQQQRLAHDQVMYAKQCHSWSRSLDRNDADSAAIIRLNRRLKELRTLIPPKLLLDLGEGKLRLSPDGRDALVRVIQEKRGRLTQLEEAEEDHPLAIEFLLRFKLRRKLLSRLARRLNRVAAHMDGNLELPYQPKYGDLRLHCDKDSVASFFEISKQKDAIILELMAKREFDDLNACMEKYDKSKDKIKEEAEAPGDAIPDTSSSTDKPEETESKPAEENVTTDRDPVGDKAPADDTKPVVENTPTDKPPAGDKAPADDTKPVLEPSSKEPDNSASAPKEEQAPPDVTMSEAENANESKPKEESEAVPEEQASSGPPEEMEADSDPMQILKEYKDAYEKTIGEDGAVKFTILEQTPAAPDYLGAGIGATARQMSDKEKEIEYQRWQTNMLARIPEQPTYSDLDLQYRVFNLEERRAKVEKEENEQRGHDEEKEGQGDEKEASTSEKSDSDAMDVEVEPANTDDEEGEVTEALDTTEETEKQEGSPGDARTEDPDISEKENNEEAAENEEDEETAAVVTRPISLVALPSFYDQDFRRIKNIHSDLISSSLQEHTRAKLEASIKDYNQAFRGCRETLERRHHVQNQILEIGQQIQTHEHRYSGDLNMRVAVEKNRWNARRMQFEHRKLDVMLPSRRRQGIIGTQRTQNYRLLPDRTGIADNVGECLGDIIDAVEGVAQGMIRNERFNERFVHPPAPPGFDPSAIQRLKSIDEMKRNDMKTLSERLHQTEELRKKAWRKLMKTKAEFELPHQRVHHDGRVTTEHVTMSNYGTFPAPPLQHARLLQLPSSQELPRSAVASYRPVHMSRAVGPSQSIYAKYAPARIRERTAADGSVVPASKPKQNKDGLYQRPAGRTRKGMLWDAVEGIWRPDPHA